MNLTSTLRLNNGVEMPTLGLGTFQSEQGDVTRNAVLWALEGGYRHIDTASIYGNEGDVGRAIHESGVPREQIFVTTKLWNHEHAYEAALRAYDNSLKLLGLDYVDLYLVHWPINGTRGEAWRALLHLYEQKRVRAIGVSNYTVKHLQELLADSPVVPAVNQFELSPFLTRQPLVDFCRSQGIAVESYSPLARGRRLDDPRVDAIAKRYGKSHAQIMVRWALDKGYVVIPKSVHRERIQENADLYDFALTAQEVSQLDGLNENYRTINPPWMKGEWEE